MANILVRDVPDKVHAELRRKAELTGQSLQQYLQGELRRVAERPTLDEWLARVESRSGGSIGLDDAVVALRQTRR